MCYLTTLIIQHLFIQILEKRGKIVLSVSRATPPCTRRRYVYIPLFFYVWDANVQVKKQKKVFLTYHLYMAFPRASSSSRSSPSSNSFKNRAWSCSLFLFRQYLYTAATPADITAAANKLTTTSRTVCLLFQEVIPATTSLFLHHWSSTCFRTHLIIFFLSQHPT